MAKVSIIIPVYNVERYLKECLDSVQNQTLQDIEVICVDDGSKDTSGKILDEYAVLDKRFRVIHKKNEGYGKALNVGIAEATSRYIGIVESDDSIEPDMYETLYSVMEETQVDVVKSDYYEVFENYYGKQIKEYVPMITDESAYGLYGKVFNIKEHENVMLYRKYTWNGLYRASFLRDKGIVHNETPGAAFQDNGFWFQTMIMAKSIYILKKAFYRYRIDNANSSIHSKENTFAVCNEYDFIDKILKDMGNEGEFFYKWSSFIRIRDSANCITRVADENKEILAERVKQVFMKDAVLGRVDYNLYSNLYKEKIFKILASPHEYAQEEKRKRAKLQAVSKYSAIIVYGAGKVASQTYELLKVRGLIKQIKYFAVTVPDGEQTELKGVPIVCIDSLKEERKEALVIVAVGRVNKESVVQKIKELQFENYIYYMDLYTDHKL